jgi:hypothetical protein
MFFVAATVLQGQTYPPVKPLERMFDIPNIKLANVNLIIRSEQGAPLYRLQCHSNGYAGDEDFDYSGDFECRLSLAHGRSAYSTLLTEDPKQSRDWESRARFFSADLKAPCAAIVDFGATRTFRLRGMRLTLQIVNPSFGESGGLRSLELKVTVGQDSGAKSDIAEAVGLPQTSPPECRLREYFVNSVSSLKNR